MGEPTNTDIVYRFVAAFNDRDPGAYDALVRSDVVDHHLPPGLPAGAEGVKLFVTGLWQTFDARIIVDDIVASEDLVACRWTFTGTHIGDFNGIAGTGRTFSVPIMTFDRFVGGRIAERWEAFNMLDLLQQIEAVPV
ncbi:ester cyclase [Micromonospora sp. CA-259024]|uniref:ester cyclase n=1 Tax=Micromonospora sp. CA-259024 TaxID=3239965 RepID=UPI003D8A62FF